MVEIGFGGSVCSRSNCAKSVHSFGPAVFFALFSRTWLSFGGAKSQNEFAAKNLCWTKLPVMATEILALNRSGVLAGANFIACGAAARLGAGAAAAPE